MNPKVYMIEYPVVEEIRKYRKEHAEKQENDLSGDLK